MKILLIHYRYYIQGGPERYLFNVKSLLEKNGHTVIPFSVSYPQNQESEYSDSFVKPIVNDFHISKAKLSVSKKVKLAASFFYNSDAKRKIKKLIEAEKPDVAYVLLYQGKLTYSVLEGCKECNLPVIHRISDFYHYCINSAFFRNGQVCTSCLKKPSACVKNRCAHGSLAKSVLNYFIEKKERMSGIRNYISHIICPSEFTKSIFEKNIIYPNAQFHLLPTFFNFEEKNNPSKQKILARKNSKHVCYIGRIVQEKGIENLLKAWKIVEQTHANVTLDLTGFFDNDYSIQIKQLINELNLKSVNTYEFLTKEKTFEIIDNSFLSLIPSIWYDNMPNSFIESQAFGLPVIVSDIGSLTELVKEEYNGWLFKPQNYEELAEKIIYALELTDDAYVQISDNSYNFVRDYCSPEKHYDGLIKIFEKAISRED